MNIAKDKIGGFFKQEYKRMKSFVQSYISDCVDSESDDIIQDVMIKLSSLADVTVPLDNLSSYVYRALKNRIIDIYRSDNKNKSVPIESNNVEVISLSDDSLDVSQIFEESQLRENLIAALGRLSEAERTLIIMTEYEGKTVRYISEKTNEPVGTLLARKSRAANKLRYYMKQYI
ncbi:MAG: sigma-70 family RNA polymerase sigma factor [Spirochaetes bacterium]|nr:sigma-70 family RNA polymerase sigma factor [Spirochaetota bacterium]MBN2770612.1 sigma-70 family RNA polymerase sigma factor [Spirochaetota bacterium]